jgi:hypothetical protein
LAKCHNLLNWKLGSAVVNTARRQVTGGGEVSETRWFDLGVGEAVKIGDTLVRLEKIRKGRLRLKIDLHTPVVEKQAAKIGIDDLSDARQNRN